MDDAIVRPFLQFSDESGRRVGNYERLCAMEPCLRLKRSPPHVEHEPGTARSAGQRLIQ